MTNLNNRKGDAIRILTSKYKECDAWIDTGKKNTRCKVPVIIETNEGLKSTRIDKENVTTPFELPVLYEEAAFQQKPEMDLLADQLMKKLAHCNIIQAPARLFAFSWENLTKRMQFKLRKDLVLAGSMLNGKMDGKTTPMCRRQQSSKNVRLVWSFEYFSLSCLCTILYFEFKYSEIRNTTNNRYAAK